MTAKSILAKAKALPTNERIRLVQDLWDTIAEEPENVEISDEHRRILDERLREHEENPTDVVPWEAVKDEAHKILQDRRSRPASAPRKRTTPARKRKASR